MLWLAGEGPTLVVRLRRGAEVQERFVEAGPSLSATLEVAALVARALIRAALEPTPVAAPPAADPVPPPPAPATAPAAPPAHAPAATRRSRARRPPAAVEAPARSFFFVQVGWQLALDGETAGGHRDAVVRAAVGRGTAALGLHLAAGAPAAIDDPWAHLTVAYRAAAALVRVEPLSSSSFDLRVAALVGASWVHRVTRPSTAMLDPAPAHTSASLLLGAELEVGTSPWPGLRLSVALGADWMPSAPVIGYGLRGSFQGVHALWAVQPRAAVLLEAALP